MVVRVVPPERDGRGDGHGYVAQNCHDLVDHVVLVSSEMDEIVYAAVQGVAEEPSDEIGVQ
jgi:hypothetical protein